MKLHKILFFAFAFIFISSVSHAVTFTGNVENDFSVDACYQDENGRNLSLPSNFPAGMVSGFDVDEVCLVYVPSEDTFYVGVKTFSTTSGPVIFGDADGDGDAGRTSTFLAADDGIDLPNLSGSEYFSFLLDFDADFSTPPDAIAGVPISSSLPTGYRVSAIAFPYGGLDVTFLPSFYGAVVASSSGSHVYMSPDADHPHLEFTIQGFSRLPGYPTAGIDAGNPELGFIMKDGSLGDDGIGDEDVRMIIRKNDFFDVDNDGIPNASDPDQDNDTISDTDEDAPTVNTDGTDNPDYLDLDSDNDGILDATEAGDADLSTPPRDTDHDGIPDFRDTDSDNDGVSDADEIARGTDPYVYDAPPSSTTGGSGSAGTGGSSGGSGSAGSTAGSLPSQPGEIVPGESTAGGTGGSGGTAGSGTSPIGNPAGAGTTGGGPFGTNPTDQPQGSGLASCQLLMSVPINEGHSSFLLVFMMAGAVVLVGIKRKKGFIKWGTVSLVVFLSSKIWALNNEHFRPSFDNISQFRLLDTHSLSQQSWTTGLGVSFANSPLEGGNSANFNRVVPIVDDLVTLSFFGAYGITDWLSAGVTIPVHPYLSLQPIGSATSSSAFSFGDVSIAAKAHVWDHDLGDWKMALSVSPQISLPTGESGSYLGDKTVTGSLQAAYELTFGDHHFLANTGFRFRSSEKILRLNEGQEWLFGFGYQYPIWKDQDVSVLTEITGSTSLTGSSFKNISTPMEWTTGARKGFETSLGKFNALLGASLGITHGYGTPDYRILSLVTYEFGKKEKPVAKVEPVVLPAPTLVEVKNDRIETLKPIYFETNKADIKPESYEVVTAVSHALRDHSEIRKLSIEGHTDDRGSDKHNLVLSNLRAESVKKTLIKMGVQPSRLSAKGFGESKPIASNKTVQGMAKNRRTEFKIITGSK